MADADWIKELPVAITVSDAAGVIVEMNDKACATFAKYGGAALIGRDLIEVHPEAARPKLKRLLAERATNVYTITKAGARKLILQTPWYAQGAYAGFVELSFELPAELPDKRRD